MTEEKEKELILGNSQLISLFFVVVALCGVFFALGYMIGRNSGHPQLAGFEGSGAPAPSTAADRAREPEPAAPPADTSNPAAPPSADTGTAAPPPAIETQPAKDMPGAPASANAAPEPAPVPARPAPAQPAPAPVDVQPVEPGATYLQVAALSHEDAAKLVRTLREQELPARLAASPKPEMFRVLVGPYRQPSQVADAKERLKKLGFDNAFVQK